MEVWSNSATHTVTTEADLAANDTVGKRKYCNDEHGRRKVQCITPIRPVFVSYDTTPTNTVFVSHDLIITHAKEDYSFEGDAVERVRYSANWNR